jgi:CRP-like cAMP-binding protein
LGANKIAGIVEMIAASPDGLDIVCLSDAVVLELEKADFLAFCSENFEMLAELLRTFSARVLLLSPFEGVGESAVTTAEGASGSAFAARKNRESGFVDRLLLLHRIEALRPFGAETISDLAVALKEKQVSPPTETACLTRAGQPLDSLFVVLSGSLELAGARVRVNPGSVFGLLHSVSEAPLAFDLIAHPNTRVLTCRREVLSDLLEDNIAFTLAWLRRLAERILELSEAH